MAKPCSYFAPNGKPSKLYDSLFAYYNKFAPTVNEAEKQAAATWLITKTPEWVTDFNESDTDFVDENGEYAVTDERIPFIENFNTFNNKDNLITVRRSLTGDDIQNQLADLQNNGLKVLTAKKVEGATNITGTTEADNMYFNNEQLSIEERIPVNEFLQGVESSSKILKSIIAASQDPFNVQYASRIALSGRNLPKIQVLSRADINSRFPIWAEKSVFNMGYDSRTHSIIVNSDIALNNTEFEAMALEQISYSIINNTLATFQELQDEWSDMYNEAKAVMESQNQGSKYLATSSEFLHGVFHDSTFRRRLESAYGENEKKSLLGKILQWIMKFFNLPASRNEKVKELMNTATSVMNKALSNADRSSKMAGVTIDDLLDNAFAASASDVADVVAEDTDASNVGKIIEVPVIKPGGYYTNQLTADSELLNHFIKAHLEKIRSLEIRTARKGDKIESKRLREEKGLFKRFMNEIKEKAQAIVLIPIGFKELNILEKRLDSDSISLNEVGESLKLLDAWRDFSKELLKAVNSGELTQVDDEIYRDVNNIVGTASDLHAKYLTRMFNVFKERAAEEHIPPDVIAGVHVDMTVKDIGMMAANFIGLSLGENPLENIADFMIRISADRTNREWLSFEADLDKWFKRLGTKDISRLFTAKADGTMQLQMRYDPKFHEELTKRYADVKGFEFERLPLVKKLWELQGEYNKATAASDKKLAISIKADIREVENEIKEHTDRTKGWDDYMEFMRENFQMDLMKVHIPAQLEDADGNKTDNPHPDAGTTKLLKWDNMSQEEMDWALQDWYDFRDNLQESFTDYSEDANGVLNKFAFTREAERYDPTQFIDWYKQGNKTARPKFGSMWFAVSPNENLANTKFYDGLSKDWQEFYDWFSEEFVKAHENIPQEESWFGDYERDKLIRNFIYTDEKAATKMKYLTKDVKNWFQDIYSVTQSEGDSTLALDAPLSKRPMKRVKFRNLKDIAYRQQGYFKKGDSLPADISKAVADGAYVWNDKNTLVNKKGEAVRNIIPSMYDPVKIFSDFKKMSLSYKYKKSVEDVLTTDMEIVHAAEVQAKNKFGAPNSNKVTNWMSDRLASTVNAYLYDDKANPIFGKDLAEGERKASATQVFDSLNKFTRVRQLGLNLPSGITNLGLGTINNFMFAGRDEFFNEGELKWAYSKMKGSVVRYYSFNKITTEENKKILLLMKRFNLFGNFLEDMFLQKGKSQDFWNKLFIFQKGGEYVNQGAVMLAMMKRTKVKDAAGNVIMENGKEVSLFDALDVKDGQLINKYKDSDYANEDKMAVFGMAALQQIKEIHGDYDLLNFKMINKKLFGRAIMMFRNWLPMAVETRLGGHRKDNILSMFAGKDVEREGRWRSFGSAIAGGPENRGFIKGAGRVLGFMAAAAATTLKTSHGTALLEKFGITSNLKDYQKMNMAVNLKEAWWLMAISMVGVMLKNMIPAGDDDDKDYGDAWAMNVAKNEYMKNWITYLYNQSSRVDNDLWFYYNPVSFYKVLRDPIPMGATLMQAAKIFQAGRNYVYNPEKDIYQQGMRKGNSKFWTQFQMFWPIVRQKESLWSMWSNMYSNQIVR